MTGKHIRFLLFAVIGILCGVAANAATSLFSNYGQIQNVQNYSTNPFWTPNSPYNQRLPQPVYVQGADLNTDDCIKVVQLMVSTQCMARDNCKNTSLYDVRPAIMVALSNLPGNNYVSACSGYIDGVYESYVQQYGNNAPTKQVAFPTGTVPNQNVNYQNNNPNVQFPSPTPTPTQYQQPAVPQWQQEINERTMELQSLQNQNGADSYNLSVTDFPTTYSDLSFSERMANETEGYKPYAGKSAYYTLDVMSDADYCPSHQDDPACAKYNAAHQQQTTATNTQQNPEQNGSTVQNGRRIFKI